MCCPVNSVEIHWYPEKTVQALRISQGEKFFALTFAPTFPPTREPMRLFRHQNQEPALFVAMRYFPVH